MAIALLPQDENKKGWRGVALNAAGILFTCTFWFELVMARVLISGSTRPTGDAVLVAFWFSVLYIVLWSFDRLKKVFIVVWLCQIAALPILLWLVWPLLSQ